jgi:hypothetical protein
MPAMVVIEFSGNEFTPCMSTVNSKATLVVAIEPHTAERRARIEAAGIAFERSQPRIRLQSRAPTKSSPALEPSNGWSTWSPLRAVIDEQTKTASFVNDTNSGANSSTSSTPPTSSLLAFLTVQELELLYGDMSPTKQAFHRKGPGPQSSG